MKFIKSAETHYLFLEGRNKSNIMAKEKKDVNIAREWAKLGIGVFFAIAGVGLIAWSMLIPPAGVIHATVLGAFGTLLTWAGAMFGMDSNTKIKMHEQDIDFEIKKMELDERMRQFDARLYAETRKEEKKEE